MKEWEEKGLPNMRLHSYEELETVNVFLHLKWKVQWKWSEAKITSEKTLSPAVGRER